MSTKVLPYSKPLNQPEFYKIEYANNFSKTLKKVLAVSLAIFGIGLLCFSILIAAGYLPKALVTAELLGAFLGGGILALTSSASLLDDNKPKFRASFKNFPLSQETAL